MRKIFCVFAALTALSVCGTMALAQQNFPTKPVRLLIPYAAGGAVDILGRTLGDELSKRWGQPVIIENRTGAGGTIASQVVAKSDPDGYTLVIVASGHAINPYLYTNLPYDTFKDFTADLAARLLAERDAGGGDLALQNACRLHRRRARRSRAAFPTACPVSAPRRISRASCSSTWPRLTSPRCPTRAALRSSTTSSAATSRFRSTTSRNRSARSRAGTLRPLGVTSATRSAVLPDVPTIAEAGVPGYDTAVWWGLLGPAGLSADLAAKISRDCAEALNAPAVKSSGSTIWPFVAGTSPAEFDKLIRADYEKWGPIIKAAGDEGANKPFPRWTCNSSTISRLASASRSSGGICSPPGRRAARDADRRPARHRSGRDHRDAPADHLRPLAHHGDDHAGGHLLRRAVRRIDDVDPGEHPGRGVLGGDLPGRLPDGAPGPGRSGAGDRGDRIVLRRLRRHRGRGDVRPAPGRSRLEVRPLRVLLADGVRPGGCHRPGARIAPQGDRDGAARPAARRRRHRRQLGRAALHLRHHGLADGIGFIGVAMGLFGIAEIVSTLEPKEARDVFTSKIGRI